MKNLAINNVTIIDVSQHTTKDTNCYISKGKFVGFDSPPDGFNAQEVIDAKGAWLMPGLVDLSVNLFRKNQNDLLYLENSLSIAKSHGIKILCQWPVLKPAFDNPITVRAFNNHFHKKGESQVLPIAALTNDLQGETIANLSLLKEAGAIGFSQGDEPITNTRVLLNAFDYAASFGLTVFIRPNDPWLKSNISIHDGTISAMLGIEGIPVEAEVLDLERALTLAKKTGVKIHISGVSSREGVHVIKQAKQTGLDITADVAIPNLFLTEMDLVDFSPACHLIPPLRSLEDQNALLTGIKEGVIDVISSHNRSCSLNGKQNPLALTPPGYHGFTAFLPLLIMLSEKLDLSFSKVLKLATLSCYDILKLSMPTVSVGKTADFILVDANKTIQQQESYYQSPFSSWYLRGDVLAVCFDGVYCQEFEFGAT